MVKNIEKRSVYLQYQQTSMQAIFPINTYGFAWAILKTTSKNVRKMNIED